MPPPAPPAGPEYEDLDSIPDHPHDWGESWEGGCHSGRTCRACDMQSDCEFCDADVYNDQGCLREQADNRNEERRCEYVRAVARYEAQMDYWRAVTGRSA
ncbi:MAG: hypothetical protein CK431_10300 [Mycobacterium sp.]|nr:MAG: hypothetical protein CK431_10300 [Mycobacterium sp.]